METELGGLRSLLKCLGTVGTTGGKERSVYRIVKQKTLDIGDQVYHSGSPWIMCTMMSCSLDS